jgi:guanylate kinase
MATHSRRKQSPRKRVQHQRKRKTIRLRKKTLHHHRPAQRAGKKRRVIHVPGRLFVVSAPSGSGKTTIAHEILRRNPSFRFSVSATTRPRRPGETDGKDYYFLTKEEFRRRVDAGEFVEWEEIYGEYYGTLRSEIDRARDIGESMLFDIDVKGALSIKKQYPEAVLIFIRPPSVDVLVERLRKRHTEDEETLERRLARVPMEMEEGKAFDVEVVNDNLSRAVEDVQSIVENTMKKQ